ncbi:MAG: DNA-3-methyladenine glycosylase [Abditibacteriales bacterium]|nr:DNA-3-methyladenine glycosylase [Abditibacteriales bacterium]MDW8365545.1 DNA-3-methyladenine glycosylase [Abditibacteriales bacterium]
MTLPRAFYLPSAREVAPRLLGKLLLRRTPAGDAGGVIVETEAYLREGDPSNHAARGMTPRNRAMFGAPGIAYVYAIHQQHCLNAVTCEEGVAEAVLIRALQPALGIDLMRQRRQRNDLRDLCSGPGKLCQALAIDLSLNFTDLTDENSPLMICAGEDITDIVTTTRIGIRAAADLPLRFYVRGNEFVSKR